MWATVCQEGQEALKYGTVTAMWGVMGVLIIGMAAAGLIALILWLALPSPEEPYRRDASLEPDLADEDEKLGLANGERMR